MTIKLGDRTEDNWRCEGAFKLVLREISKEKM